jgi:hypothetical protein
MNNRNTPDGIFLFLNKLFLNYQKKKKKKKK